MLLFIYIRKGFCEAVLNKQKRSSVHIIELDCIFININMIKETQLQQFVKIQTDNRSDETVN